MLITHKVLSVRLYEHEWLLSQIQNFVSLTLCRPETPKKGSLANNEDPDEMTHNGAFHQGPHCLIRQNRSSEKRIQQFFENYNSWPLNIYNGPSWLYCMYLYGKFHWSEKGENIPVCGKLTIWEPVSSILLISFQFRLVVKTALKLLLVFIEYTESNTQHLIKAVNTVDKKRCK